MAETYGWTLDVIDDLSLFVVQRLGEASLRMEQRRKPGKDT
jgi:hypothetical protein